MAKGLRTMTLPRRSSPRSSNTPKAVIAFLRKRNVRTSISNLRKFQINQKKGEKAWRLNLSANMAVQ